MSKSKATDYLTALDKISEMVQSEMVDYVKLTPKQRVRSAITDVNNYILFRNKLNKASVSGKDINPADQAAELTNMERARVKIRTFGNIEYTLYLEALEKKLSGVKDLDTAGKKLDMYDYITTATSFCHSSDEKIISIITSLREKNKSMLEEGLIK